MRAATSLPPVVSSDHTVQHIAGAFVINSMTPQQAFGVVVRSVGLYLLLKGLAYFLATLRIALGTPGSHFSPLTYIAYGFLHMVVGLVLMTRASSLTRFCYADPE